MKEIRLAALVLTALAVLVLVGSMVSGIRGGGVVPEVPPPGGEPPAELPLAGRVRVEVLNASGIPGLARRGTDRLRARGFDVVYYGNATGFGGDTSLVLARSGDERAAERVARELGIEEVRTARDTTLYLEVTVILGRDWRGAEHEP